MSEDTETFRKVSTGDFVVEIVNGCEHNGVYSEAYSLGFPVFDEAMKVGDEPQGGVRDGDLVVITGRSGEGKTSFAQNIIKNLAEHSLFSIFFSYEVIVDNLLAKFRMMGMGDEPLVVVPKKIITGNLKWVKEKIVEAQEKYFIKFVVIDHIDFLSPSDNRTSDQLRMVLKNISLELKSMALELKVVIFLIAHTKKVEGREIEMQDIAESSGIYQLADYVFSVSRGYDEYEDPADHQKVKIVLDIGRIKLLKNRLTGIMPYMNFRINNNIIEKLNG